MNSFLIFLAKSTLILSLLYLAFSILMRKDTFFKLNRITLLLVVICSVIIPFLYLPQAIQPIVQVKLEPIFQNNTIIQEPIQTTTEPVTLQSSVQSSETKQPVVFSVKDILLFVYLSGVIFSFLLLIYGILSVLLLFRKARKTMLNGIRLMIVDQDIPAFSFGRNILISQHDFDTNAEAILTHEQSHIRLGHFYDLMLMELVKIIFWFNPLVYRMVNDLKEIHEFQADDHTLHSGIDATQYQLLIIQKCVGHQKFALANSFNHCQIKNRITMMNKQKTSKAWRWKVATFLPLLALLLLFCGRKGGNAPTKIMSPTIESPSILGTWKLVSYNYSGGDVLKPVVAESVRIKLITETNFSWNQYSGEDKTVINSAGGSYVLSGDSYTESIEYGGKGMANYIGKVQKFKIQIENDKMQLSGELSDGLKIKEVWQRIQPSDKPETDIAPTPSPFKDKFSIYLRKDGKFRWNAIETPITENELAERVKSELQRNPKLPFVVMIEEGKIDERVDQIKEILKTNGNPKVRFFSFHDEKREKDSKGLYSSVLYSKPMDIK